MPQEAKLSKFLESIESSIFKVFMGHVKKMEIQGELSGKKVVAVIYRLNEQVPARVDFKVVK